MGLGRTLGRSLLKISREADKLGEGLDRVFGKNRKRPGDGFSQRRVGKKAAKFTEDKRDKGELTGGLMNSAAKNLKNDKKKSKKDFDFY